MPAFTPQPQSITGTQFAVSRRVEGWVDLSDWLHTEITCRLRESNPDTVTHPSTNRAQRRLTSLIYTAAQQQYVEYHEPLQKGLIWNRVAVHRGTDFM